MIAAATLHNCVTTYMSRLTDSDIWHCFKAIFIILMDTFETSEFILGQIAYTFKCNSYNLSMQPPVSLTLIHVPVILPYISNTVYWINIMPGTVYQSDTMNDFILSTGHCDQHFMVQ